jgi:serine/threonine-protein kinase RsbW
MSTQSTQAPEAVTFERDYPGTLDQARQVRADLLKIAAACPVLDDMTLLASELAANSITHSRSGDPGGVFTMRAILQPGDYAWVEVTDQGGLWGKGARGDEHGRGLDVVAGFAGKGNWGISGDESSRSAWFRLDWPGA